MDTSKRKAEPALIIAALLITLGTGFAFAEAAPEPIQNEYSAPSFDSAEILEILRSNYRPGNQGNYVLHEPMEGHLNEQQAANAARESAALIVRRLTGGKMEFSAETALVMAYLAQLRPFGQEQIPLDPKYSFWNVTLTVPGEFVSYQTLIHAQTGTVWKSQISYLPVDSGIALNTGLVLSGFEADLGFDGLAFDEDNSILANELGEDDIAAEGAIAGGTVRTIASIIKMDDIVREGETPNNNVRIGVYVAVSPTGGENEEEDITA
jgi:hypothetical protein